MRPSRHVLLVLLAAGCAETSGTLCDTRAVASVQVTVTTTDGAVPADLSLVYHPGPYVEAQPCDDLGDGGWVCGWEAAGELYVTASATGYAPVTQAVTVEAGECHVVTELLALSLEPGEPMCTAEVVPSVEVTVADSLGAVPADAVVTYDAIEHGESGACASAGDRWICGQELDGIVRIHAEAPGFLPQDAEADVQADACHVITEQVAFTLLTEDEFCTQEVVHSVDVIVTAVDASVPTVTWASFHAIDAGVRGDCTAWSPTHYMCGEELAGRFEVTVGGLGYVQQTQAVLVEEDVCHVLPELLQVQLVPEEQGVVCTDVVMPSVIVNVSSGSDAAVPLTGVAVDYAVGAEPAAACDSVAVGVWQCGQERAGDVTLHVSADGHVPATRTVTVGADECHVRTETVDVVLEPVVR